MTTSITAVSASTRSAQSITILSEWIQLSTGVTLAGAAPPRNCRKIGQDSAHDTNSAPVVTLLAATLPSARLPSPAMIAASSGRNTISWMEATTSITPSSG